MNRLISLIFVVILFLGCAELQSQEKELAPISFDSLALHQKNGIKLKDNWSFYWKQFIDPSEIKNQQSLAKVSLTSWTNYLDSEGNSLPPFGYATYSTRFSLSKNRANTSLYIPRIIGAYKIWINGDFILETGNIGKTKATTLHRRFTKIIPLDSDKTDFEIVVQVANFYNRKAGITEPILIGTTESLFYKKTLQIMADMISIGSFSFVGLLFLIFYFLYWNKDKAVLYFSVMCIALAYHTLNDRYAPLSNVFTDISWIFLAKLEYIASYIVGYCASLFFVLILKEYTYSWYIKMVKYCTIFLIAGVIITPAPYFTYFVLVFLLFMLLNIIYIIATTIKAIIAKSKASSLLLFGIVITTIIFLANILFFLGGNEIALIYVKFGYILVFLFISMLLLRRFSHSFHKLELANELAIAQKKEIASKSKELIESNEKLAENLKLLESINEELEDFNYIVSHDLKTPLISIYSLTSFIEEDLKDNLDKETENHLKMIKDVISKTEASINGLLDYSKVAKSNKLKEHFSIHSLLNRIVSLIDSKNKHTIHLPKKDLEIYANRIELSHVFQNLISNAIKYNDKKKAVITIDAKKKNTKEYLFSVSDNGPGIDKKYHQKIFKIFSQLKSNPKDVKSTGLGLAIVKKLITKNKGKIKVNSVKGEGLTISFTWEV